MASTLFPLQVSPTLPPSLKRLGDLAQNFWFSWYPPMGQLFRRLDSKLWRKVEGSPTVFLKCVDQGILESAADDPAFLGSYQAVVRAFDEYLAGMAHTHIVQGLGGTDLVAYFCAEYGLHESFPIYSGGLGVLAGDHCKTASDMCLPFVAVGLLYRQGYFNQRIDRSGQQIPEYPHIEARQMPISVARTPTGEELKVMCPFPERTVAVRVWEVAVGRVTLLLLDTDVEENNPEDRRITYQLYGGDRELRLQQEAVLGVGGVRALRALGLKPTVWHINEGHAAFSVLERLREHTTAGVPFRAALEAVAAATVFTTHTPVSAGHDVFPPDRVGNHFASYATELGIDLEQLLDLGRSADNRDAFNMTRLAIRGAAATNGVSKIHGRVSSRLCQANWPDVPATENPVGYVTNGVHVPTFMRQAWVTLLDEHLGAQWRDRLMDRLLINKIAEIPDERFWTTNQKVKRQMLRVIRERLTLQHTRNGLSEAHIHRILKLVNPDDPNVLTIGFARRFATYKRATLLMTDLRWLEMRWISSQPQFIGKILLLEGYDMGLSRLLTSGVDVWLNTPVHPFEASGTSGMKAAINGTVNLSVLDGWWAEAYDGANGWGIPPAVDAQNAGERDRQDAVTLYEILQDEVIPLYYARDERLGFSPEWVALCKRSMASVLPHFNSERVLRDYLQNFYVPAARQGRSLAADDFRVARDLAAWKQKVAAAWQGVQLKAVGTATQEAMFNEPVELTVEVELNGLAPADVRVECVVHRALGSELTVPVVGYADSRRPQTGTTYIDGETVLLDVFQPAPQQPPVPQQPSVPQQPPVPQQPSEPPTPVCRYQLQFCPPWAGALLYEIRAVPQHPHLPHLYELGLMRKL